MLWVISSTRNNNLYWNKKSRSWVAYDRASVYKDMERFRTTLPDGGEWQQWR